MPSQPADTGWDFSSVIGLIDSGAHDVGSPTLRPTHTRSLELALQDGGVRLGSFTKLFQNLGFPPNNAPLPPLDPESELSNSDDALLPSPTLEAPQAPVKHVDDTAVELPNTTGLSKSQRRKARKRQEEEQNCQRVIEETLNQLEQEREQRAHKEEEGSICKQLDEVAETPFVKTPSKPSRAHSRSNVGAKIRPTSPSPVVPIAAFEALPSQQEQPKTHKRPSILKRPSVTQPETPQPLQPAPVVVPSTDLVSTQSYTTFGTEAPPLLSASESVLHSQNAQPFTPIRHYGLIPRTVRPVILPRTASQPAIVAQPPTTPTPYTATPIARPKLTIRSKVDRHFHLFNKLLCCFPDDRKWLVSPMQLLNEKLSRQGLHIFVDASNIMIGLKETLRRHRTHHNAFEMSFDSLALLMERRRPVAKRFFAGSHREANPLPHVAKLVETSKAVGYDSVMQEQVLIVREDSGKKKFFNDVKRMGWYKATQLRSSGSGSDSETGPPAPKTPATPKWVEQGVDEILHLKMCQSILDTEEPSTMVLATGDGAVAEMSDGFLAHVERALKKGWKVELVSWGQQINSGYRKKQFRAKWADQFTIIELDAFLEDLIDTP
ncbi:hypothetical protein BDW02DRAFT_572540 [Decorospora gaudefroyi]|uniref:NYN domain-containing protein n=1 Tax=Decorospora gaudefroyi TaxID=184978 RepID=A0A6A5K2A8_9PLEO|nr:hypothetical protein BDW02DRAFT_572540 [Decorospora gaudefroyi]